MLCRFMSRNEINMFNKHVNCTRKTEVKTSLIDCFTQQKFMFKEQSQHFFLHFECESNF